GDSTEYNFLSIDPRITQSDFTAQPKQYFFTARDQGTCAAVTGWTQDFGCNGFRGDAVVSQTGWNPDGTGRSSTQMMLEARAFVNEYDVPALGKISLNKVGDLLNSDTRPPGDGFWPWYGAGDPTVYDTAPAFSGNTLRQGMDTGTGEIIKSQIIRW